MRAHQQAAHMHANDPIKISAYPSCKGEPSISGSVTVNLIEVALEYSVESRQRLDSRLTSVIDHARRS
jgi:hypothetical protein